MTVQEFDLLVHQLRANFQSGATVTGEYRKEGDDRHFVVHVQAKAAKPAPAEKTE